LGWFDIGQRGLEGNTIVSREGKPSVPSSPLSMVLLSVVSGVSKFVTSKIRVNIMTIPLEGNIVKYTGGGGRGNSREM
jgi:hypothetical protein